MFDKKEYNKKYREENKEYYQEYLKEWHKQFSGYYLYIILNGKDIQYVGMTTNYYNRLNVHTNGLVEATRDIFTSGNWTSIKYIDLTEVVNSEIELKLLENALIDLYDPRCNSVKNIIKGMDKLRELQLLSYLHSAIEDWKVYKINEDKEELTEKNVK